MEGGRTDSNVLLTFKYISSGLWKLVSIRSVGSLNHAQRQKDYKVHCTVSVNSLAKLHRSK